MSSSVSFYLFGHYQPYLGCHWHLPLLSASTLTLCLWGISLVFCSISQTIWFLPCPHFLQGQSIHGFDASVSLLPPLLWPEHHPSTSFSCRWQHLLWPTVILCRLIVGVALLTTLSIPIVLCCIHNSPFIALSLALSRPSVASFRFVASVVLFHVPSGP